MEPTLRLGRDITPKLLLHRRIGAMEITGDFRRDDELVFVRFFPDDEHRIDGLKQPRPHTVEPDQRDAPVHGHA